MLDGKPDLILARGLPGAGKTSFAFAIAGADAVVVSADDYFTSVDGEYTFDPHKLRTAHEDCQRRAKAALEIGHSPVIVANTFTQEWEMTPYFEMAREVGARVFSIVIENRHNGASEHGVPVETFIKMRERFDLKL